MKSCGSAIQKAVATAVRRCVEICFEEEARINKAYGRTGLANEKRSTAARIALRMQEEFGSGKHRPRCAPTEHADLCACGCSASDQCGRPGCPHEEYANRRDAAIARRRPKTLSLRADGRGGKS